MTATVSPEPAVSRRKNLLGAVSWVALCAIWLAFEAVGHAQKLPSVLVAGDPVAPSPVDDKGQLLPGTGLCAAYRFLGPPQSQGGPDPALYFKPRASGFPNLGVEDFPDSVNDFMDGKTGASSSTPRNDASLLTPFDLTNFFEGLGINSKGDFVGTPGCPTVDVKDYGCWFPAAPTDTTVLAGSFGARFRGFVNILPEWVNQTIHFGFLTDEAVAMHIFTKAKAPGGPTRYTVISRGIYGTISKYRVSNGVLFRKAGIYPIEVTYAQYGQAASLEMAVLVGSGSGFSSELDEPADDPKTQPLGTHLFVLTHSQPNQFFQTSSGVMSYDGQPSRCRQCPRSLANVPNQPNGTCDAGMFCNEAAVCAPCIGDQFCGKSCKQCIAPEPFCVRDPRDPNGDYTCVECVTDKDCSVGKKCALGKCINPCNCCPGQFCVATDSNKPDAFNCSQCRTNEDCGGGACDLLNGRCTDKVPDCNADDRCGKNCVNCASTKDEKTGLPRPYCLNGEVCVQCRYDSDCGTGTFCRSGDCVPCTDDRHCGPNCKNCGLDYIIGPDGSITSKPPTEKPFCVTPDNRVETAVCVRCKGDKDCGEGGTCDQAAHTCTTKCAGPCPTNQVCDGSKCVECFTNAQCPCGVCVEGQCTPSCETSTDCLGTQCCSKDTKTCIAGRCKPGLTAHGGALCCGTTLVGSTEDPVAPTSNRGLWIASLLALGMLGWPLFRRARG